MYKGQPPTKHAKDKSNSDALVAADGDRSKEGCGRILVGCSSEKDSGYSGWLKQIPGCRIYIAIYI